MNNNRNNFVLHSQLAQDTVFIKDLPLCQVRLMNDSQYPWVILVPRKTNCVEVYDLNEQDFKQLHQESLSIGKKMMMHFQGDKLNIAALGNVVPQLHIHHIVRFKSDIAWPAPVWGKQQSTHYTSAELKETIAQLNRLFD